MDAELSYAPREWAIFVGGRNRAGAFVGEPRSIFVEFKTTFKEIYSTTLARTTTTTGLSVPAFEITTA